MTIIQVPHIECECGYKGPAQFKSGVDGIDDYEILFGLIKIRGSKTLIIPCPICGKKNEDKSPEWMKWVI